MNKKNSNWFCYYIIVIAPKEKKSKIVHITPMN